MGDEGRFKLNVQTFALRLRIALKFKLVAFGQLEWIGKPKSYSLIPNFDRMSSKLSATPCSGRTLHASDFANTAAQLP